MDNQITHYNRTVCWLVFFLLDGNYRLHHMLNRQVIDLFLDWPFSSMDVSIHVPGSPFNHHCKAWVSEPEYPRILAIHSFYKNERVVAESDAPTSHLLFPNTCNNNVKHSLRRLSDQFRNHVGCPVDKTRPQSWTWRRTANDASEDACTLDTSLFSGLGKQTKRGKFSLVPQSWPR